MGVGRHRGEVSAAVPYAVREGRPVRAVAEECDIVAPTTQASRNGRVSRTRGVA